MSLVLWPFAGHPFLAYKSLHLGSHAKYRKTDGAVISTVIVPAGRKEVPRGTFRSILRQSGLDESVFGRS